MRNLDDLESQWRGESDQRMNRIQGLEKGTRDAYRHAGRMAQAGQPMMNGFAVGNAYDAADQLAQESQQQQASFNQWAGSRDLQSDRNLMNAAAETNQYKAETARMDSNNQLAGQRALADSISNMGNSYSQMPNQQQGNPSASLNLYGSDGQRTGGGQVLGGLIEPPKPKQQQQQRRR
jgi:hypothetical protein